LVNTTSIALDDNIEDVLEYVNTNNLNWRQGFLQRYKTESSIIAKWNIKAYPTLLLFGDNNNFVYAGNSERALVKMDSIMSSVLK
jgi:hypothetical protein